MSIYNDPLTTEGIVKGVKTIKNAFPALPIGFYDVLSERLKENNFTNQRLHDAISNLIDTCIYPTPTIANIISWDKRIKLYTYAELVIMANQGLKPFETHKRVYLKSKIPVWATLNDIETYKLPTEQQETA